MLQIANFRFPILMLILCAFAPLREARAETWFSVTNDVSYLPPVALTAQAGEVRLTVVALQSDGHDTPSGTSQWVIVSGDGYPVSTTSGSHLTNSTHRFRVTSLSAGSYSAVATVYPVSQPSFPISRVTLTVTNPGPSLVVNAGGGAGSSTSVVNVTVSNINTGASGSGFSNLYTSGSVSGSVHNGDLYLSNKNVRVVGSNVATNETASNITFTVTGLPSTPPTNGNYILQSSSGVLTYTPVGGLFGANLAATILANPYAVTNIFSASGTNTQTWTWTGGTTSIIIKAWGAAGGSVNGGTGGSGHWVLGQMVVTNGTILTLYVGLGGPVSLSPTSFGWPDGGAAYGPATNASRAGGGGSSRVLMGTNIVLIAAGGGASAQNTGGGGGFPTGVVVNGSAAQAGGGGSQSAGGAASSTTIGMAGSYLQGGSVTGSTTWAVTGGGGLYGGGAGGNSGLATGGGGSSFGSAYLSFFYCQASGLNTADADYISGVGVGAVNAVGGNGKIIIETPSP